jgi:hypothetical protein
MISYLIDPHKKKIKQVNYNGDFQSIYMHINSGMFDVISLYQGESLFIDDMGLERQDQSFFIHKNYPTPIAGIGLLLGTDETGESIESKKSIEELQSDIVFIGDKTDLITTIRLHGKDSVINEDYRPLFIHSNDMDL